LTSLLWLLTHHVAGVPDLQTVGCEFESGHCAVRCNPGCSHTCLCQQAALP